MKGRIVIKIDPDKNEKEFLESLNMHYGYLYEKDKLTVSFEACNRANLIEKFNYLFNEKKINCIKFSNFKIFLEFELSFKNKNYIDQDNFVEFKDSMLLELYVDLRDVPAEEGFLEHDFEIWEEGEEVEEIWHWFDENLSFPLGEINMHLQ